MCLGEGIQAAQLGSVTSEPPVLGLALITTLQKPTHTSASQLLLGSVAVVTTQVPFLSPPPSVPPLLPGNGELQGGEETVMCQKASGLPRAVYAYMCLYL